MFPSLKDPEHANVRFKNVRHQVYLCVTTDETGNPVLGTKTISESVDPDGEYGIPLRWLCSGCATDLIKCRPATCQISVNAPPPPSLDIVPPSLSATKVFEQEFSIVQYFDLLLQISLKNEGCHVRSCT
jgi:hypothetical protein